MTGLFLLIHILAPSPDSFDLSLDELPPYVSTQTGQTEVEDSTPEQAVDWDSLAPKIRTADQYREAKDRAVPVIWFEGQLYFLSPEGKYRDALSSNTPTPTPRPFGEVELANGTQHPVDFYLWPDLSPRSARAANVPPFSARRFILPLGVWKYIVRSIEVKEEYIPRGEFSVEPLGTTHILYGFQGRSLGHARNWLQREPAAATAAVRAASPPAEKPYHGSEVKINQIFADLPRYPNALSMELPAAIPNYALFKTLDSEEEVLAFYERTFSQQGWDPMERRERLLSYVKPDRKVVVEILPAPEEAVSRSILLRVYPLE